MRLERELLQSPFLYSLKSYVHNKMYLIDFLFTIEKATYSFFGDHPLQHMVSFYNLSFLEKPLILKFYTCKLAIF
jgi:hypothetical protein